MGRRLEAFPDQIAGFVSLLAESLKRGFYPPEDVVKSVPEQLRSLIADLPEPLQDLPEMPEDPIQKRELRDAIRIGWTKGLERLLEFVESTYLPKAVPDLGLQALQRGNDLYAAFLYHHTTLKLTPAEVHQMGLDEVSRLNARYKTDVFEPLGHTGTVKEFAESLKGDPKFYFSSGDDLVESYRQILQNIEQYLPEFFEKIPKAEIEIVPRSEGPAGIYVAGTPDGSRSGRFNVNTEPLAARPRYEQVVYALHEGSPGHHLQNSLCIENDGLPNFLRLLEERRYEWIPARRQAHSLPRGLGSLCGVARRGDGDTLHRKWCLQDPLRFVW